jgi:arabinose-5-phosphate isomerase
MSMPTRASTADDRLDPLRYGRRIIELECQALARVAERLDDHFCRAAEALFACRGSVIVCGMGNAGLIAQKIAATLASTGTRSHFLHPAEAVHGDLGRIHHDDLVLAFSQSGETEEVVRLLPALASFGVPLVAVTTRRDSTLGRAAVVTVELGPLQEACALGLAPSASTTAMLAIGDALALVASQLRGFRREDFARFHPAGSLGRELSQVDDYMRPLADCRLAQQEQSVRRVFVERSRAGRRSGAIMLTDDAGRLAGIFTDSDLARLFERHRDDALDRPIREVMTSRPATVPQGSMMVDAVAIMAERKISELPVIDDDGQPRGLLDVTDVVALFPQARGGAAGDPPALLPFAKGPREGPRAKSAGAPPRECA